MKTEQKEQLKVIIKLLIIVVFATLYALGGLEGFDKSLRRFIAPIVLILSMFGFSKDYKTFIQLPFMILTLHLGYSAENLWLKILKRGIFGFSNGISSSIYNGIKKKWLLVGTQIVLLMSMYIIMGVWNPLGSARAEESFLGLIIALIPLLSIK